MIVTCKYQANIETPTTYTGYLVDGGKSVPMDTNNRDYQEVQLWIAEGNTPEDAYIQQELDDYATQQAVNDTQQAVNNITVLYNGFTYSGSEEAQAQMTTAMQVLAGKGDTKTRNFADVDGVQHKLNRDDFDNLLDMIEPLYENITDD